jgi:hypothetical protein
MLEWLRNLIRRRANGCCEYCISPEDFSPDTFSIEHIVPIVSGGTDDPDNLAFSCQGCNNQKYTHQTGLDPIYGHEAPLFHPRKNVWNDHFHWSDDYLLIIGSTPTGRATVETLELNRTGVLNLRRALLAVGEHPAR